MVAERRNACVASPEYASRIPRDASADAGKRRPNERFKGYRIGKANAMWTLHKQSRLVRSRLLPSSGLCQKSRLVSSAFTLSITVPPCLSLPVALHCV